MLQLKRYIWLWLCLVLIACQQADKSFEGFAFRSSANGGWGLMANDGTILVPEGTYAMKPSAVVGGMFTVPDGKGRVQLYSIDNPKSAVTSRLFTHIGYFFEEVTIAQENASAPLLIINKRGDTVAPLNYPQYHIVAAHNFDCHRALVITSEGKYGYVDNKGNLVIPPAYDSAFDFHEDKAIVGNTDANGNTDYLCINTKGTILFNVTLNNVLLDRQFCNGLLMFKELDTNRCGYLNDKGQVAFFLPNEIHEAFTFAYSLAVVQSDRGMGIVNDKGDLIVATQYENASIVSSNRIALRHNGKWALADDQGKLLTGFIYETIGSFNGQGTALTASQGKYHLINQQGKSVSRDLMQVDDPSVYLSSQRELFVDKIEATTSVNFTKEKEPNLPKDIAPQTPVGNSPHKSTPIIAACTVRHNANAWREISRQSPFYAEAAKVLSGKLSDVDAENRRVILNYVEHLRTSYTTKDIDFLNQLFSENALIIVGNVIRTSLKERGYLSPDQVTYNLHSKQDYLTKLKIVFKANKKIDIKFSNFHIMRHPTIAGIYGVTLRQRYTSDRYQDDGYLFLLWDFRNEAEPKIHVRTWQPAITDNHTPLPEDAVFNIRNFNLQ